MCGIAGVFDPKGSPYPEEALAAMQKALVHRRPVGKTRIVNSSDVLTP